MQLTSGFLGDQPPCMKGFRVLRKVFLRLKAMKISAKETLCLHRVQKWLIGLWRLDHDKIVGEDVKHVSTKMWKDAKAGLFVATTRRGAEERALPKLTPI